MLREHPRTQNKLRHDLGEIILKALEDDTVHEILLNPDGLLWADGFKGKDLIGRMTAFESKNLINTVASIAEEVISAKTPSLASELWVNINGELTLFRFQAFIPPIVPYPAFAIRKRAAHVLPLEGYLDDEIISVSQGLIIREAIRTRQSILVVGGTQSGKTTFCNALLDEMAKTHPNDRVILIEDTQELRCEIEDTLALRVGAQKSMNDLIAGAMRLRPDRIVIGEVRGGEAHSLIKAWNTGHQGGISTIHANSALSGILRLEQLIMEAGVPVSPQAILEAINLLIFIQKDPKAKKGRRVTEIIRLLAHDPKKGYTTQKL